MTEEEKQQLIADGKLNPDGTEITPENNGGEPDKLPKGDGDEPKFTQAQLDEIIEGRLLREKKKREQEKADAEAEAERKRLEDNQEFKGLAEQYKAELDAAKEDARLAEVNSKKTQLLVGAGYNEEQIARYGKYVEGETEEDMKAAVEQLKKDVPPTPGYVDPNSGNTQRQKPAPKDKVEKGRSYFQRLKGEGKIR